MHRIVTRIVVAVLAVALAAGAAMAAESKPRPKSDDRPGVAEYNAGVKLMQKGKFAQAEKKFRSSLEANEKMAPAHNNLAYSIRKQGPERYDEAMRHYDRAIELNPKLAEAYMYRGVLRMLTGDEAGALADHKALVPLDRGLADALQAAIASGEEPDGLEGLAKAW